MDPINYAPLMAQVGANAGKTVGDWTAGFGNGANLNNGGQGGFVNRLAAAGQSVTQGYGDYAASAQKAKALRQVVAAYAQDEPDPDKQKAVIGFAHTAGLADLEGYVQGHVAQMTAQKQQADIAEQKARGGYYDAFAQQRQQQAEDDQSVGQFLHNYFTAPKDEDGEEMDPTDKLNYAGSKTPNMSGRALPQALQSISAFEEMRAKANQTSKSPGLMKTQRLARALCIGAIPSCHRVMIQRKRPRRQRCRRTGGSSSMGRVGGSKSVTWVWLTPAEWLAHQARTHIFYERRSDRKNFYELVKFVDAGLT